MQDRVVVGPAVRLSGFHEHVAPQHPDESFGITLHVKDGVSQEFWPAAFDWAVQHGLLFLGAHDAKRTIRMHGKSKQFANAFDTELQHVHDGGAVYRVNTKDLTLPSAMAQQIEAVLGFDTREIARSYRVAAPMARAGTPVGIPAGTFTPPQVAQAYGFPVGTSGAGQSIAIIELGGGYRVADLRTYFASLNIPMMWVYGVGVDGGANAPTGDPDGPDGEVMLDVEIVGAVAPNAKIVVYFADNTDEGFSNAILAAVHDTVHQNSVISISWGSAEDQWSDAAVLAMEKAFQQAQDAGITVLVASGDNGSSDGERGNHADYPASSALVTGCGGTRLTREPNQQYAESVWNDGQQGGAGGGGFSSRFSRPTWQQGNANAARGVPDISGNADPESGYDVRVDGQNTTVGGTSAVAPLYAGLVARINQATGTRLGFLNPLLYGNPGACRDVTRGNDGTWKAAAGWDAASGLGSVNGAALLAAARD